MRLSCTPPPQPLDKAPISALGAINDRLFHSRRLEAGVHRPMFIGSNTPTPAPKREISTLEDDEDYLDRPRKKIFTTNPVPPPFVKRRDFAYGPGAAERMREGISWALEVQRKEEEREAELRRKRDESLAKYHAEMQAKRKQEADAGVPMAPRVPSGPPNGNLVFEK